MAQTPMGDGASLMIDTSDQPFTAVLDDGNGNTRTVAQADEGLDYDDFKWLVSSAATFHGIPFYEQ